MDDHDLDHLLTSTRPQWDDHVLTAVQDLVSATRCSALLDAAEPTTATASTTHHSPQRPGRPLRLVRRRTALVWVGVAAGMLTLAAAGTVSAYQLSIPPFQTTEQGVTRVPTEIPVDYTDSSGRAWRCHAFLEYRHLHHGDSAAVAAYISGHDWDGFGAAAYAAARAQEPTATGEQLTPVFYELVDARLRQQAEAALPGTVPSAQPAPTSRATALSGTSFSCERTR